MKTRTTEQQLLQNYQVLFSNVIKDTVLAAELAEYGYTAEEIANGIVPIIGIYAMGITGVSCLIMAAIIYFTW